MVENSNAMEMAKELETAGANFTAVELQLPEDMPLDSRGVPAKRDRIDRYLYSRPPDDVLDAAARAGLRDPAAQD